MGGSFGVRFSCDVSCLLLNVMVTLVLCFDMMRAWYLCGINLCFSLPMSAAVLACRMMTPDHCNHCTTLDTLALQSCLTISCFLKFPTKPLKPIEISKDDCTPPKTHKQPESNPQKGDSHLPALRFFPPTQNLFWLH